MIVGLGIDIVELARIDHSLRKFGERFRDRILTPAEVSLIPANPIPFLAGRFAAKEAAVKALGTGFSQGVSWHDIEILNEPSGKPCITFHNHALRQSQTLNIQNLLLSISHGQDSAVAVVILEQ